MRTRFTLAAVCAAALVALGASAADAAVAPTAVRPCAQPNGRVSAMAISNGTLFIGGTFTSVQDRSGVARARTRLAAIDVATCDLTSWTAPANGEVLSIAVAGSTVYVGGSFTSVGSASRSYLAALSASSAQVQSFNPVMNKTVRALVASSTTLYAGGDFAKVGAASRAKLAAFSLSTGALSSGWQPKANGKVNALALSTDGGRVYAGGLFTTLNGLGAYPYLGAVDSGTGKVDAGFAPHSLFGVLDLVTDANGVYVGQAGSGGHLLLLNQDGTLKQPVYQLDGDVQAVAVDGDSVYGGGHFTNYCVGNTGSGAPFKCDQNLSRRKLIEVSASSGQVTSWAPSLDSPFGVLAAVVDPSTHDLWVGGDFTHVSGQAVAHLAKFPAR